MNLCSDKHEEICHEGRDCPFCAMRDDKNNEISDLKAKVEQLESEQE